MDIPTPRARVKDRLSLVRRAQLHGVKGHFGIAALGAALLDGGALAGGLARRRRSRHDPLFEDVAKQSWPAPRNYGTFFKHYKRSDQPDAPVVGASRTAGGLTGATDCAEDVILVTGKVQQVVALGTK